MDLLGLGFAKGAAVAIVASILVMISLIAVLLWYRGRERVDPVQADYLLFCSRMAKKGVARLPYEAADNYARRIIVQRPDLKTAVAEIIRLYNGLRYGKLDDVYNRRELHRLVRSFRANPHG